ncbi:MAG: hypothetical protein EP330_00495 [Deltaproteobacteria bacterium]|nr:MAG: hypothetical protein EP330_00495 [Deltaproteobacteria bacterium]
MPRRPRIDYADAVHHVMNRAVDGAELFPHPRERHFFLHLLAQIEERYGIQVLSYALMPNHFHLLVRSTNCQLSRALQWLQGTFASRINRRYGRQGALFGRRFRSRLVTSDAYFDHLVAYIHLNPKEAEKVDDPLWTSHVPVLAGEEWIHAVETLARFGGVAAFARHVREVQDGRTCPDFDADDLWTPAVLLWPAHIRSARASTRQRHGLSVRRKRKKRSGRRR